MSTQSPVKEIKIGENTFKFFVVAGEDEKKMIVRVVQHTDFTGTILEDDFPNGDTQIWETEVSARFSEIEAVNLIGGRLIEDWSRIASDDSAHGMKQTDAPDTIFTSTATIERVLESPLVDEQETEEIAEILLGSAAYSNSRQDFLKERYNCGDKLGGLL